jgi:hypothetical protein
MSLMRKIAVAWAVVGGVLVASAIASMVIRELMPGCYVNSIGVRVCDPGETGVVSFVVGGLITAVGFWFWHTGRLARLFRRAG